MAEYGLSVNIPKMKEDLRRYKIEYDEWFLESSLHDSGYVAETVGLLADKGWTYEKDGALWLNTTALLKQKFLAEGKSQEQVDKLDLKDDVLRRANGFYTYFAADIAYHRNKLEQRGFSKAINIWGADHHGHGPPPGRPGRPGPGRLPPADHRADAAGQSPPGRPACPHVQALRQGHRPAGSAGRGERGRRPLLLQLPPSTSALDFDLDLAVRRDSENPVYYVQYAHARICSLIARLAEEGHLVPDAAAVDPPSTPRRRRRPLSKPCPNCLRSSAWPPGITIPPASTAIW